MSGVEFIGFAISLFSLLFLFFRNRRPLSKGDNQVAEPSQEDFLEEDPIQAFLKTMEKERKRREVPPIPSPPLNRSHPLEIKKSKRPSQKEEVLMKSELERRRVASSLENAQLMVSLSRLDEIQRDGRYEVEILQQPARARKMLDHLTNLKDIVIFREILDKPKSLRPWE